MKFQSRTKTRSLTLAAMIGLLAAGLSVAMLAGTARAAQVDPPGSESPGGYTVRVKIQFTGEAAPGGGALLEADVQPSCWWQPARGPYTDAVASLAWYDVVTGNTQTRGVVGEYGPRRIWKAAADAEAAGTADTSWYRAFCKDPKNYARYDAGANEGVDPVLGDPSDFVTYYYRAFDAGAAIPPPLVDPEQLARAAREVMVIPEPVIGRNPKIHSAGAPTLVGLPTWFWVENDAAVGGADGARDITARLGAVSATVTAKTGGLKLSSPAGGKTCVPSAALVEYHGDATETSACTVEFARASTGYPQGYPVAASTNWEATWVGTGNTSGVLEPLARGIVENVPVAEVQNIVTRRDSAS